VTVAQHVVNEDNDRVRVTTWTFAAAGDATGPHVHEFDYIGVPVSGGRFEIVEDDGSKREMEQAAGSPYVGTAGTSHDVISASAQESVFVEIELKR
jgi:beta-alanine degradation protein BauB